MLSKVDVMARLCCSTACACSMFHVLQVVRQLEKDIALKLAQRNNAELAKTYAHLQVTAERFMCIMYTVLRCSVSCI